LLNITVVGKLLISRPDGTLDMKAAEEILEFVELKEMQLEKGFDRFCDLRHLDGIRLTYLDVFVLADRRREFNPNLLSVRSAFLATNPLAFGIARMYEQLLNSPRIEIRVWSSAGAAADWLGVGAHILSP
jgi:hypothetical protein